MTAITLEQIQAKQSELASMASMIAQLLTPAAQTTTIHIPEDTIELAASEHYAGALLDVNGQRRAHLVLMAAEAEQDMNWQAAMKWAEAEGGALPTRQEQALLFANCKTYLKPGWHWSCEEHEDDASSAWICYFNDGSQGYASSQGYARKSYEGSAVAVRLIALEVSHAE